MNKEYEEIYNRLNKNLKQRKSIKKDTNAFRLYDRDLPQYPYIIDLYAQSIIIYEKGKNIKNDEIELQQRRKAHQENIVQALKSIFPEQNQIIFKSRKVQKGKQQYIPHSKRNKYITVFESDRNYLINPLDYIDCGLFLDHRILRKKISEMKLAGTQALHLFCYTGSISVAMAKAGAIVTSVDLSNSYIEWSKDNFKANMLSPEAHHFIRSDTSEYLNEAQGSFHLIVIDPPTFSNSKKLDEDFSVQKDHVQLLKLAKNLLHPEGIIYFSNNFRQFKLAPEVETLFSVHDISLKSIPMDFKDKKIHKCFELKHL